ncbi:pirin-like C-terminal cupin domain-containing protein [Imperialibacter roseus]|uniref:Pirin-like C-terminal cupin domain-containing protein n=1 Tax=Imperialibacter roseus TaxID=1324217 RepID=A0ABZ0IY28_9BACT|nr:pirin-like C-terminal cupin domain-containing protein [Imperialibacter roseus]WOK09275.1 pirin-like C-terminal cupin domain-containing protein [Imperialibacter roseus]
MMSLHRKLGKTYTPADQQGFLGLGHVARAVIQVPYPDSDPFIMLMDDMLDKKDNIPVGGPHPHAGFETVTLMLEGEMGDEKHTMKAGDLQLMTAGSGIVHTETIDKEAKMRILQLWLNLPKKDRQALPRVQDIALEHVPTKSEEGLVLRLYSGSLGGFTSPIKNYTPFILADITLQPGATTVQDIPASYTAFLYAIDGNVLVGNEARQLNANQVGWLDRFSEEGTSQLRLEAGETGARVILYAGQPQNDEIVSHGPFIADTQEDIRRLYREYRNGEMNHISMVEEEQKMAW